MSDRLRELELFVRLVESGSFTAAARDLGVQQPAVSKAVAAMEHRLGVRLVQRNSKRVTLTEAGAEYVEHARAVLDLYEQGTAAVRQRVGALEGPVRLTASTAFGRLKLASAVLAFMREHARVSVKLVLHDGDLDLVKEGLDMAVRVGQLPDSALVVRRVGQSRRVTVASRAYIENRGEPKTPHDLSEHECVVYTRLRKGTNWFFRGPRGPVEIRVRGRFHTDSSEAALGAVLSGFGIGHFPFWLCADALRSGKLEELMTTFESEVLPLHLVFPERRLIARRTRALADFLEARFARDPDLGGTARAEGPGGGKRRMSPRGS